MSDARHGNSDDPIWVASRNNSLAEPNESTSRNDRTRTVTTPTRNSSPSASDRRQPLRRGDRLIGEPAEQKKRQRGNQDHRPAPWQAPGV